MNAQNCDQFFPLRIVLFLILTAVTPPCVFPVLAEHPGDGERATVETGLAGGASLEQLFPDELKYWPDLERVLNRKPFQTFTSFDSIAWLDGSQTIMCGDRAGFAIWDVAPGTVRALAANRQNTSWLKMGARKALHAGNAGM